MSKPGLFSALPEHIAISRSRGVDLDWRGGHHSAYTLSYLRDQCPCATCTGAHGTPPQKTDLSTNPFQMYKPALRMDTVEPVGNYALRIVWNDGHNSGIYSYDYLREICPCQECRSREAPDSTAAGS